MLIEQDISLLEEILSPWREIINEDYVAYKNHTYRMLHFCFYLNDPTEQDRRKLIIAAAFHDIGIWSAQTIDYLPPSVAAAQTYLKQNDLLDWADEISSMIELHHQIRANTLPEYPLVEVFRKGDLIDFSLGLVRFGVPGSVIKQVKDAFPNAGFHKRLVQLSRQRFASHPLNPFPMMRW